MHSVHWVRGALDDLTTIWLQSDSALRTKITSSVHQIDKRLHVDPTSQGESRPQDRRILIVAPLGITFKVLPDDVIVRVLDVWIFEQHESP